ncbi:MAG: glycine--tRNA ligase [Firmicutes bacterium]|nr:glycine--tRNA ligase [Bacillota bacterium]
MKTNVTMDKIVSLSKMRGFVFPGSEIYGGLANSWDYGPLGVLLKNNIKNAWWKKFVTERNDVVGLDCAIIMNPMTWEASGHIGGFSDPLMDCKKCKTRHRADTIVEDYATRKKKKVAITSMSDKELEQYIEDNKIPCPHCGLSDFTKIKKFNLMLQTFLGVTDESSTPAYLRPETAQGIFVNFKNVVRSSRAKVPFGIAQIGKSFRNEITPKNFIFRTREFEQMELEFFCKDGTDEEWFEYWQQFCYDWVLNLGVKKENLSKREHDKDELSHYSKATTDLEYQFPFGMSEFWGIANRTDFDLKAHQTHSKESMEYLDPATNEKYIPFCIEPSVGVERLLLMFLCDAYCEEQLEKEARVVLKLHHALAPYKIAILPLQKHLSEKATAIYEELRKHYSVDYDLTGSIGKRYRRQDEIGTPYCVTIDFDTLEKDVVTIRDRDTMDQITLKVEELKKYFDEKLVY